MKLKMAADQVLKRFSRQIRKEDANSPPSGTSESYSDYTSWTSVSDLKNLQFYWKTFGDQRVRFIDLKKVLVKSGSKPLTMAMGDQSQEDMGDQLK